MPAPTPKDQPLRSELYRRYVAMLPCYCCGVVGYSQAAHADQGKGLALKSDDRTCYPLCGPHPSGSHFGTVPGCHHRIGSAGHFTRDVRRSFELDALTNTQAVLCALAPTDTVLRQLLQRIGLLP